MYYICDMENGQIIQVVDITTNEIYPATIYQTRKTSYLVRFKIGLLPFSRKTGKIFGKNMFDNQEKYLLQIITGA